MITLHLPARRRNFSSAAASGPGRVLSATVALVLAVALLPSSAAYAAIDVHDGREGDNRQASGSSVTRFCDSAGNLWVRYSDGREVPWLRAPNIFCVQGGSSTPTANLPWSGVNGAGEAGWEVWRFYGTPQTVQAWSVSRINLDRWGTDGRALALSPHPDDARGGSPYPAGSVWRHTYTTSASGERVTRTERGLYTTNPPFRFGGGTCDSIALHNTAVVSAAGGSSRIRTAVFENYTLTAQNGGSSWGWREAAALNHLGLSSPPSSPSGMRFSGRIPCASYLNYLNVSGNSIDSSNTFVGYCIMPLQRLGTYFNTAGGREWATRFNGGIRYASAGNNAGDPSFDHWRAVIENEVNSRRTTNVNGNLTLHRSDQVAPGQPFRVLSNDVVADTHNRSLAARVAALGADCRESPAAEGGAQSGLSNPLMSPQLRVSVSIPDVFQIGGQMRRQQITVNHTQLLCDGGPCPIENARQVVTNRNLPLTADHVTNVNYQIDVRADGLRACSTSNPSERCDFRVTGPDHGGGWSAWPAQPASEPRDSRANSSAANHRERRQRLTVEFFSATNPGERVHVRIRNLSATYATYSWARVHVGNTNCVNHVNGAPVGTTTAASQGNTLHRLSGQVSSLNGVVYHAGGTPGGSVQQWYWYDVYETQYHGAPYIPAEWAGGPVGELWYGNLWAPPFEARPGPFTARTFIRTEQRWRSMPLWVCSRAVHDEAETSRTVAIPSNRIQVTGEGSRTVIGVNQQPAFGR